MSASPHVELAMQAIREYVENARVMQLSQEIPEELAQPAASFVSLKKHGVLRGCIGTIEPRYSMLAEEIVMNGISAATQDPRFQPVEPYELDHLNCSVDVLTSPEEIEDICLLDPVKYGVIVQAGQRRGLLLPNLDGVETVEYQLEIARQKAMIGPDEQVRLFRFSVNRYY